jgi:uncharacterized membrane protein YphA (DoxX/SURF4 family)
MESLSITRIVLRLSLALAFLYPALSGFIAPQNWVGYFPPFLFDFASPEALLTFFGIFEVLLALWILSGRYAVWANSIAGALLALIVLFNFPQMNVVFRDISLIGLAIALILLHRENHPKSL